MKKISLFLLILTMLFALFGCQKRQSTDIKAENAFNIASGSENEQLETIFQRFASKEKIKLNIDYMGSVDIMLELKNPNTHYDAVLPANSLWIALGDSNIKRVKLIKSIMHSPVVFGIKKSIVKRLGWLNKDVTIQDILKALESGQIRLMSTSATQSNSGAAAYIGYLYAFAGNPPILTEKHISDPIVTENIKRLLSKIERSSGSSGWLKNLFIERYDRFDAIVNYESMIISANQELVSIGKEPIYAIYPINGLAIADSPFGYIDKGNPQKASVFKRLQDYLLSDEIQQEIQSYGRRTKLVNLYKTKDDKNIFNPGWGINTLKTLKPIKFPQADVIFKALNLYQATLRKPSLTVYALDFSGSMYIDGENKLKEAITSLLDPKESKKYLLQASDSDITIVLPFNHEIIAEYSVTGNDPEKLKELINKINKLSSDGGTDIYLPILRAFEIFEKNKDQLSNYFPAVIIITDGKSNENKNNIDIIKQFMRDHNFGWDIPVFGITIGDADKKQLEEISALTFGQVFDGTRDLISAFRKARGHN